MPSNIKKNKKRKKKVKDIQLHKVKYVYFEKSDLNSEYGKKKI